MREKKEMQLSKNDIITVLKENGLFINRNVVADAGGNCTKGIHLLAKLLIDDADISENFGLHLVGTEILVATMEVTSYNKTFRFLTALVSNPEMTIKDFINKLELVSITVDKDEFNKEVGSMILYNSSNTFEFKSKYVVVTNSGVYVNAVEAQRYAVGLKQSSPLVQNYLSLYLDGTYESSKILQHTNYIKILSFK